jgi:membrane-bound lytic murein transglycosylase D
MSKHLWILMVVPFAVACSSVSHRPYPLPDPSVLDAATATVQAADSLLADLESAHAEIRAREAAAPAPLQADIAALRSLEIPSHPSIDGAVRYFSSGLKTKIQASINRSAPYREMIDRVLDEYGVPRALAYLPVIESAYIPTLTSKAGAHGLWQFMPATARQYGLKVDWWVDERADPEKSTRAAAKFLSDLYRRFGDWSLALAAYNCGPGRVGRTLEQHGVGSFWELTELGALPKETRGYVPTFFATVLIAGQPENYGFSLPEPQAVDQKAVAIEGPVSFAFLAEVTGTSEEELRKMNPHLHRAMVPPGRHPMRVPSAIAPVLAEYASTLRDEDPHVAVSRYRLQSGDRIERLAQRIGTTPQDILQMNGKTADRFKPGEEILLPIQQARLTYALRSGARSEKLHVVVAGDTLYSIARRNGLTLAELVELNNIRVNDTLQPGMRLKVSAAGGVTAGGM